MVIGNGMIASRFYDYRYRDDVIIFASGVSNSKETNGLSYVREKELLEKTVSDFPQKTLVYFSTCSIDDPEIADAQYVVHKKEIEQYLHDNVKNYFIFRVSNVAGISNNPYTLLNYFIFNILNGNEVTVWQSAARNIIGIDDMYRIIDHCIHHNIGKKEIVNVANIKNYPVTQIIAAIENHLGKNVQKKMVNKGKDFLIDTTTIAPVLKEIPVYFEDNYLDILLKKYYHSR